MRGQRLRAFSIVRRIQRIQKIKVRHFGVHDDETVAGQSHHQVRPVFASLGLFGEIAMRAHARCLHDAPQRFLAPASARLIGTQYRRNCCVSGRATGFAATEFQLLLHFAERGGLRGFALLQPFLVGFQLLLERLDQSFNRFLPLRQIAFGRFLKFSETTVPPAAENLARVCFNASALNALNASRRSTSVLSCNARCSTSIFSDAACLASAAARALPVSANCARSLRQVRFPAGRLVGAVRFPGASPARRRARDL